MSDIDDNRPLNKVMFFKEIIIFHIEELQQRCYKDVILHR